MNRISSAMAALLLGAGLGASAYAGDMQSSMEYKDPSNTAQGFDQQDVDKESMNQHRSGPILFEAGPAPQPHAELPPGSHESGVVTPGEPDERSLAASGALVDQQSVDSMAGASGSATSDSEMVVAGGTRDWDRIDANNDNLIQPEEMERWLQQEGPQAAAARDEREG